MPCCRAYPMLIRAYLRVMDVCRQKEEAAKKQAAKEKKAAARAKAEVRHPVKKAV